MNRLIKKYFKVVNIFILENKFKKYNYIIKKTKISKKELIDIFNKLKCDFSFYLKSDPSIKLKEEILISNSFQTICIYRLACLLYRKGNVLLSKRLSEFSHSISGIDIHPASIIGCPFFIDHGTGTVVGSTCVIGDFVKIYHGVTLGAKIISKIKKRHPTIEDNVTLYCHSAIFGDIVIKKNTIVKAYEIFVE